MTTDAVQSKEEITTKKNLGSKNNDYQENEIIMPLTNSYSANSRNRCFNQVKHHKMPNNVTAFNDNMQPF